MQRCLYGEQRLANGKSVLGMLAGMLCGCVLTYLFLTHPSGLQSILAPTYDEETYKVLTLATVLQ